MISTEVVGDKEVVARLRRFPDSLRAELKKAVAASTLSLHRHILQTKLSGQVLKRRTGALAGSIGFEVGEDAEGFTGRVGNTTKTVHYAAIHEFGGKTRPHVILPKRGKALAFGGRVVAKVNHPGSNITEKRYMRGSLEEKKAEFFARVEVAIKDATK